MIINKIKLNNFGIFFGPHEINIEPKKNKPVVLFGALNGSGKTTLLEGIQIALYGQSAQIEFRGKKNYSKYLKSLINKKAKPEDGASIELEFAANINGEKEIFNLKRSWYEEKNKIVEKSEIYNKELFNGLKSENVNEFIEDLMPSSISSLFFFDGEKIETLAEPTKSKKIIQDGIYSLLGIHDINNLIKSLLVYEKKKLSENNVLEQEDLKIIDHKIYSKEEEIEELTQKNSALGIVGDTININIEKNSKALNENGYELFKNREEIKKDNIYLNELVDYKNTQLRDLASEKLGLMLVQKEINEIRESLIKSSGFNIKNVELLKNEFLKIEKFFNEKEVIKKYTSKRLEELDYSIKEVPYDIDESQIPALDFFIDIEKSCKKLISEFDEIHLKQISNEKKLAAVPEEEKLRIYIENEIKYSKEKINNDAKINLNDDRISILEREIRTLNKERDKLTQEYSAILIESHSVKTRISKSEKSRDSLEKFKQKLLIKNVSKIAKLITESFAKLQRKEDRRLAFIINIEDFSLNIIENENGVDVSELSAGEKQLIAISILWSLTKASNKIFPSLIDTPLARLDSHHRRNIIKNYFPKTSEQVLIFSTDEEVYGKHYNTLQPSIAHEYLIEFDVINKTSKFKRGYFQEDLFT